MSKSDIHSTILALLPGRARNGGIDVFDHDADVIHTLDRHDVSLA